MMTDSPRTPSAHIPAIAGVLGSEHFPNGDRAALKRMALDGPAPLAFHRFMLKYVDGPWQSQEWQEDWRAIICSLAIQRDGGFDPGKSFGRALAEARFAESRLERLLASGGETLRALSLRAARQVAAKGITADWRQMADLLFCRKPDVREDINRRIARDFYKSLQAQERED